MRNRLALFLACAIALFSLHPISAMNDHQKQKITDTRETPVPINLARVCLGAMFAIHTSGGICIIRSQRSSDDSGISLFDSKLKPLSETMAEKPPYFAAHILDLHPAIDSTLDTPNKSLFWQLYIEDENVVVRCLPTQIIFGQKTAQRESKLSGVHPLPNNTLDKARIALSHGGDYPVLALASADKILRFFQTPDTPARRLRGVTFFEKMHEKLEDNKPIKRLLFAPSSNDSTTHHLLIVTSDDKESSIHTLMHGDDIECAMLQLKTSIHIARPLVNVAFCPNNKTLAVSSCPPGQDAHRSIQLFSWGEEIRPIGNELIMPYSGPLPDAPAPQLSDDYSRLILGTNYYNVNEFARSTQRALHGNKSLYKVIRNREYGIRSPLASSLFDAHRKRVQKEGAHA